MERLRAASIGLALIATKNGGIAFAQGVPDWGPSQPSRSSASILKQVIGRGSAHANWMSLP
jgi:hypothetical protein